MSIATKTGDSGETGLWGGGRVSKADLRVEAYGTVDELNSAVGFARSLCTNEEIRGWTEELQRMLFRVGCALSTPPDASKRFPEADAADLDRLTEWVTTLEARPGMLADWSIPGAHTAAAAYDVARAVCRRAERCAVRLYESGDEPNAFVLPCLNRLSDVLWLFGRVLEVEAGVDSKLRESSQRSPGWTRG